MLKKIYEYLLTINNNSWNEITYLLLKEFYEYFIDENYLLNINFNNEKWKKIALTFSPFMFSTKNNIENRKKLFKLANDIKIDENVEVKCIGNGCIDKECIMVIGMTPGYFEEDNKFTDLSRPFKPSFFFANTSKILRMGFFNNIQNIYFTNLSKVATHYNNMNSKYYIKFYSKYFYILEKEIEILKPKKIIALGVNVYNFLLAKGVENVIRCYHPSFFIFRKQTKTAPFYYKEIINEQIKRNM